MRIPLDYYRILGILIPVTDEQLTTAYHDRQNQLPRREYSELAIRARQQLLEQAYTVLSDPERRTEYEQQFLENPENQSSGIEIKEEQLAGALLLLQELGEHQLVASLASDYLHCPSNQERADLILALVLANLELSREQWHQRDYEEAARIATRGLDLLTQEQLFPQVQKEISADFYRLRPYRILELLALDLTHIEPRAKGLQLLRDMLQERQGIEGKGNDRSGLNIDNFLRFIQQIRTYLTVEEQLSFFQTEAQRPSMAATYLQVYALIAQGFAYKQPHCIQQAQYILERLSKRQDVSLEMAICALLLSQTETATNLLKKSHETEAIEYIGKQAGNSEQLLLGLCRYGEHWLQTEVFCHCRDLINSRASLKDYFGDEQVQTYLESFTEAAYVSGSSSYSQPESLLPTGGVVTMRESYPSSVHSLPSSHSNYPERVTMGSTSAQSQIQQRLKHQSGSNNDEYTTQGNLVLTPSYRQSPKRSPRRRRRTAQPNQTENFQPLPTPRKKTKRKRQKFPLKARLILGILALGTVALSVVGIQALLASRSPLSALSGEQLEIFLAQPPLEIPSTGAIALSTPILTQVKAQEILESWLSVKAQALGPTHQVSRLKTILAEPMLSTWTKRAHGLGGNNYWQYQHQAQVQSFQVNPQNPHRATIEAIVKEKASYYEQGQLNPGRSFDDNLRIRYQLVHLSNQWLIQDSRVL